jgi:hypothetical protein
MVEPYKPNVRLPYVCETPDGAIWVGPSVGRLPAPRHVLLRPYWISGPLCGHHTAGPYLTNVEIQYYLGVRILLDVVLAEKAQTEGVFCEDPLWY